jgi:hypothetical protein
MAGRYRTNTKTTICGKKTRSQVESKSRLVGYVYVENELPKQLMSKCKFNCRLPKRLHQKLFCGCSNKLAHDSVPRMTLNRPPNCA